MSKQDPRGTPQAGDRYRHWKGGEYTICYVFISEFDYVEGAEIAATPSAITAASDIYGGNEVVVYRDRSGRVWARSLSNFLEVLGDPTEGTMFYRFSLISEAKQRQEDAVSTRPATKVEIFRTSENQWCAIVKKGLDHVAGWGADPLAALLDLRSCLPTDKFEVDEDLLALSAILPQEQIVNFLNSLIKDDPDIRSLFESGVRCNDLIAARKDIFVRPGVDGATYLTVTGLVSAIGSLLSSRVQVFSIWEQIEGGDRFLNFESGTERRLAVYPIQPCDANP